MSEKLEPTDILGKGMAQHVPFPSKKPPSKLFLVIGIVGALAMGSTYVYHTHFNPTQDTDLKSPHDHTGEAKPTSAIYMEIPNILVNLRQTQTGKKPSFLKLSVLVELQNQKELEMLMILRPKIVDQFQVYLRELTTEDLSAAEGGLQRLRTELILRVNAITTPLQIKDILFKDMLIQ